jgi:multiple sugar transport system permease protein
MRRKNYSYAKYGYIFCIPFVLAFLLFSLYPLLYTFTIGFTDMKGLGVTEFSIQKNSEGKVAPFENFKTVLESVTFKNSFKNTVKIWLINFIPQILLSIILAVWFTSRRNKIKGEGIFKVMFYMPNIITAASIAILFNVLFMYPVGPVNYMLTEVLGVMDEPHAFSQDRNAAQYTVAFIQFWMWYGYTMLILISGINGINPEMFESADIDGANSVQQFFFITLPNLRTIMVYTLVTSLIGGLNMFDVPKVYLDGGPSTPTGGATSTAAMYIYGQAFAVNTYKYNTAAAASLIMFIIIVILSLILFFLMRDKDAAAAAKLKRRARRASRGGGLL